MSDTLRSEVEHNQTIPSIETLQRDVRSMQRSCSHIDFTVRFVIVIMTKSI